MLWLVGLIIAGSNLQPPITRYFPGDDLWTPFERRRGMPIGNQTSQFFANIYLDGLDHYAKESLGLPGSIRYVDDMLVFHHEKRAWHETLLAFSTDCEGLRLRFQPRKCLVAPVTAGFTFLGYRIFPTHRRVEAMNIRRFKRRLRGYRAAVVSGRMTVAQVQACVQSWVAHGNHADTRQLQRVLANEYSEWWPEGFTRAATGSAHKGAPWRVVEQSTNQRAFCEPEQEHDIEPQ